MPVATDELIRMLESGATVTEMGAHFGLTYQRICQLVKSRTGKSVRDHRPVQRLCQTCKVPGEHDHQAIIERRKLERFWARVVKGPGCWEYRGAHYPTGYAHSALPGGGGYAHRLVYLLVKGPIPGGLSIDHLCRNRGCVNPDHLEAVTMRENILRSPLTRAGINARKTLCLHGRPFRVTSKGTRRCSLECDRLEYRRRAIASS